MTKKRAASKRTSVGAARDHARCAPPIMLEELPPATQAAIVALVGGFDAVREKYHPGALLRGDVEPSLLIDFDDEDEEP